MSSCAFELAIADDLEEQDLVLLKRDEVASELARGGFKVMSWSAVFALALIRLDHARHSAE